MANRISSDKRFTRQLVEIIDANIQNEQFGVSELAYEMHMSRSNLHRRIKNVTGESVSRYLRKVRLIKAMALLKEQSYTISEVAFAIGFGSVNYFSKCFKDHFGYPPGEVECKEEVPEADREFQKYNNHLKNFPVQTTTFIGRETEINTILSLVEEHRIVSLIGTGGCGKTRLACEAVAKLDKGYKDGIWFVNLAVVESAELVLKQLMSALEIAEVPGKEMLEVLLERIRDNQLLVLLDNCEHLLKACAELSKKLIHAVPGLSLIITSREPLILTGEKVWVISPLSLVNPESANNVENANKSEAVRLFADRAFLNNPGFKLTTENIKEVATICQKVDGIPLAIELVASRTRYMDAKTMISRFEGRLSEISSRDPQTIERHKTLQATIEWSYNLLSEEEKNLFRKLCVFTGGFDLTAMEAICADTLLSKEKMLDLLTRLIDTCLVQTVYTDQRKMRYNMLETLREFGTKILSEKKEIRDISRKHLGYFSGIAEQAYDERMSNQAYWMDQIRLEHSNFTTALSWAEQNEPAAFSRLAANLAWFWGRLNNFSMAIEILERVVALKPADKETQARLHTGYGALLYTTAYFQKAANILKEGISLWRALNNKKEEALTQSNLADLIHGIGDYETAMKHAREAYDLALKLNDPGVELHCMIMVVTGLVFSKETQEARPLLKKALKLAKDQQNLFLIVVTYHLLGDCSLIEGNYHASEKEYGLSLKASLQYGDSSYTCMQMTSIAMAVAGQGRLGKALRLNASATNTALAAGLWVPEEVPVAFWKELVMHHLVGTREKLGEELADKYEEEGAAMCFEDAVEYALNYEID
jgi:non-specific serine/threonine protein kinase